MALMVHLRLPPAQITFQRLARQRPGPPFAMSHKLYHDVSSVSSSPQRSASSLVEALQFVTSTVSNLFPTPYTGTAGLAYALWRAGSLLGERKLLEKAQDLAAGALRLSAHVVDESLLDGGCRCLLRRLFRHLQTAVCSIASTVTQISFLNKQASTLCQSAAHPVA